MKKFKVLCVLTLVLVTFLGIGLLTSSKLSAEKQWGHWIYEEATGKKLGCVSPGTCCTWNDDTAIW